MKKKIILFVGIPVLMNALFLCLYFTGIEGLQQLIAPRVEGLPFSSWREFGLLEQLQNLFLFIIVIAFLRAFSKQDQRLEKSFFLLGALVMLFLFLEEIDYGLHLAHYLSPEPLETARLNLHNQQTFGERENVHYIKRMGDFGAVIWFGLIPLLKYRFSFRDLRGIIPSTWFIAPLLISFIVAAVATRLNILGLGMINGHEGVIHDNISEFRETTTYYIYCLYALQLVGTGLLFGHGEGDEEFTEHTSLPGR